MGVSPTAILEIDAFRTGRSPEVLNVQAVKLFLSQIVDTNNEVSVTVPEVEWLYEDDVPKVEGKNWEDTCNIPGGELIDEELRVSGTIIWEHKGRKTKFHFGSHHHNGDEYLGNMRSQTLVISFSPDWGKEMSITDFAGGCRDIYDFMTWIWSHTKIGHKKITNCVTCTTT